MLRLSLLGLLEDTITPKMHILPPICFFLSLIKFFSLIKLLGSAPLTCLLHLGFSAPMHHLPELTGAIIGIGRAGITEGLVLGFLPAQGHCPLPLMLRGRPRMQDHSVIEACGPYEAAEPPQEGGNLANGCCAPVPALAL